MTDALREEVSNSTKHGGNGYGDGPGKAWARLVKNLNKTVEARCSTRYAMVDISNFTALRVPDAHALALTGHAREGTSGEVHFSTYVHTGTFSLKVLKGSIDTLGEAYRGVLKGVVA